MTMTISSAFSLGTRATTGLIALVLTATASAAAQTTADSALRTATPPDSVRASTLPVTQGDSSADASAAGQVPAGASSPTAAGGDSATAAAASTPAPTGAPSTGIQPPSGAASAVLTRVEPADTTLARACAGATAGSMAPGLLTVVFRPGTPDKERAAAARAVGGTLGGPTEYGEEYVRVPSDAGPLAVVADRLIRQDPVTRVSPAPCPAPMPAAVPPATAPAGAQGAVGGAPGAAPSAAPSTAPGAAGTGAGAPTGTVPGEAGDTTHAAPAVSP
jgi:hypothetical protein